jgi:nucleotide-binding universal stress UspA family protein
MLPFRKIIVPVDYSEPCKAVVPYVKDFMERFSAQVTLVHSYGPYALAYTELSFPDTDLPAVVHNAEDKHLRDFAQEMFPGNLRASVETIVKQDEPAWAVEEVVQAQGADLVMLATRGHGPFRRFLLGSVTAKLLHDLRTNVWTGVGTELTHHAPHIPYKSVLCAVEYASEAECVVQAAADLSKAYGASLALAHIVETPPASLEIDFAPLKKEMIEAADQRLRDLKHKLGIDAPHTVLDAPIAEGIHELALRHKADVIVTGRGHAKEGVGRLYSQLYGIIRHSPCPVLSV